MLLCQRGSTNRFFVRARYAEPAYLEASGQVEKVVCVAVAVTQIHGTLHVGASWSQIALAC
jgi:hypothetical protein